MMTTRNAEFSYNLDRSIRGSPIAATDLIQTKRTLSRTKGKCRINIPTTYSLERLALENRLHLFLWPMHVKLVQQFHKQELLLSKLQIKRARSFAKKVFLKVAKKARLWRREILLIKL